MYSGYNGPSVPYLDGTFNQFSFFSAESTNTSAKPNLLLNGHPKINTPMLGTGGQFQFQLFGPVNSTNVIQASADLTTWTPFTTNVISPTDLSPSLTHWQRITASVSTGRCRNETTTDFHFSESTFHSFAIKYAEHPEN